MALLRRRYCVTKPLGGGGYSRTYLAEDVDKLNEQCVVKQLAPRVQGSWAFQKATELFEQEARHLQQLGKHPQIPTLYAYFQEGNYLYLVQEFVSGQNLLEELEQQGAFGEPKIQELLSDLLLILQSVHEQQVIHRDIKPENLIRRQSDSKLVLIDFGVAKLATATAIARAGTTIGSFGYAPIEQMQGGEAYPASDLEGLGATCFHLLTGIHPWELWQVQGYGWVADWRKHLKTLISTELGLILDKLLLQNHKQLYQSAKEVLEDLNAKSVTTQSVTTQTSSSSRNAGQVTSLKWKPKFKQVWLMGGVLLLGFFGTQLYGYFQNRFSPFNQLFTITTLQSWSLLKNLIVAPNWVSSLAISPNRQTLISGSADNTIKIWNLDGELKNTLIEHTHLN